MPLSISGSANRDDTHVSAAQPYPSAGIGSDGGPPPSVRRSKVSTAAPALALASSAPSRIVYRRAKTGQLLINPGHTVPTTKVKRLMRIGPKPHRSVTINADENR